MSDRSFLDWPFLDDSHRELSTRLEAWCADNAELLAHGEDDVDASCRQLVTALAKGGWLDYCVPASHGGKFERLDVRSLCLIRETLGRHSGLADFAFAMQGLGSGTISLFGTDAQKDAYLPAVREGKKIAAFALSEPEAGSDVAAMATEARTEDGAFVLDGEKTWISNAGIADYYVAFARTGEAPGARGLSCFIVDADADGVDVRERFDLIAPHPLGRVGFSGVKLAGDALLGEAGRGFQQAMATLDIFRSTVGAAALGFARRALDEAVSRVTERQLFGAPLAELQIVQGMLADMALAVDTAALLVYRSAWTYDVKKTRVTREAAMAKLQATEGAQVVIDQAVQLFGALGVVSGVPVETLYREIRALRIYEGASEVQKLVIARQLLRE